MKKIKEKIWEKLLSLLLVASILLTAQGIPAQAEMVQDDTTGQLGQQTRARELPKNPVHHCTKLDSGTDTTDWSYVYFGSYPQTEVIGDALTTEVVEAFYDANGNAWIDGIKYCRISRSDTNDAEYFGDSEYRYFKWEPIKWKVLENDGNSLFVVADKGLDCKKYHEEYKSVTWETSALRSWLNKDFYGKAFSSAEQAAITGQVVVNEDHVSGTEGGNDTRDKIFLLSGAEVTNPVYGFCEDGNIYSASRFVQASDYSHARGTRIISDGENAGNCLWNLRSPGYDNTSILWVVFGPVGDTGAIRYSHCAVVPALHINLSSDLWSLADDGSSGGGSGTVDTITDYETDVVSFMKNKGTLNTIKYLCTDSNFTNSIYVHENDGTFASNITMILSDVYYRGMDGWKDLFSSATSKEEAKKILAALLQGYQSDVEELAMAKNAKKYADYFVTGLKDYVKADSVISSVDSEDIKKLSSIITEQKVEELLIEGEYGKLSKEFQKLGGYSQESEIVKTLEGYMSSKSLADTLSKGLKFMGEGLTILSMTQDTFNYLYQLESLIDADDMYSEMLLYLKNNCCFDVVKDAAGELYSVIHGAYTKQLGYVTTALKDAVTDKAFDLVVDKAVAALPYGEIIKAGFDWGVNISNLVFHTGDTQKLKDNMRTVAYMGNCLSLWTLDNQMGFLTAVTDSEKNLYARKLYYSMYMLWNTRKVGEETLQSMFTKSYSKWSKYYTLSLQISSTLDSFKNSIFTDNMKEALMSVTVSCPVDIEVYDSEGRLVAMEKDGEECSGHVDDVYYYVKYQKVDDDYIKILCFPDNSGYTIKSVGKNLGTVDSVIVSVTEEGQTDRRYFENIPIENDTVITVDSISPDSDSYTITNPSTGESKMETFQSEPEVFVPATDVTLSEYKLELEVGSSRLLTAIVLPDNASEKKVVWNSSNESVAVVNSEGVVTAIAGGDATIFCTTLDDIDKTVSCEVNVLMDAECIHQTTEIRDKKEATCTVDGYTGDTYCKDCNTKIETGKVIAATGRHIWDKGKETKVPTCTQKGEITYACTVCGQTKTEELGKTSHIYKTIVTKATTAQNGSVKEKCTGCGKVKNKKTIFAIKSAALSAASYTYNGKAKRPSVTVRDSKRKVISKRNYTIAYKNNKKVGKATVTIKLKGNYKGTLAKTFQIVPKGTSVSGKITAKSKGFTVKWKKQEKSTAGYQVQYATSKKFAKKATVTKTIKKNTITKLTVKKLKPRKKYYVRVRTYQTVKGKSYCSGWSKSKEVKTKK